MAAVGSGAPPFESRKSTRKWWTIASKTPAESHRLVCCYTASHGGKSCGMYLHAEPVRTTHLSPFKTSRRSCSRWGGVLPDERQIRSHTVPFFVGNVAWVRFSSSHARMLTLPS